jgi:hypothetical protein
MNALAASNIGQYDQSVRSPLKQQLNPTEGG